ncbi:MAG: adenosylcobinamide amidohydrolase, partial [Desulfobacteraceae bacterium]
MNLKKRFHIAVLSPIIFLAVLLSTAPAFPYPVEFIDSQGNKITINDRPSQVVSLVPSITEIIFKIGAGDAVKAITYHDTYPSEAATKEIIGGFFSPSLKPSEAMRPDVIFFSHFHKQVTD